MSLFLTVELLAYFDPVSRLLSGLAYQFFNLCSISVAQNLDMHASGLEERFHFAHKIALDLFR